MKQTENAVRIQTSLLNGVEKKALVWLAERQPRWMTSDILTAIGSIGAFIIGLGYILAPISIHFLWLSCLGFFINWYGDSLDGTLARVRKKQRPIYGFYLDHTIDCINEMFMFLGLGLSGLMHFDLALFIYVFYLLMTVNVSVNAHLKGEFKLTYAKLGPTELRIIAVILNMLLILVAPIREFAWNLTISGHNLSLSALDLGGIVIFLGLACAYFVTIIKDAKGYAKMDPMPED